jgi:serine/threonine-protein kinase
MSKAPKTQAKSAPAATGEGAVVGRYRLVAKLGQGGMADVYLAVSRGALGVNKLVVIKQLRAMLASDHDFAVMFLDEARLAVRLSHPNVVHTYEVGGRDGHCFLVMEYLEGQSVGEFMQRARARGARVAPTVWARIAADALAGLHYAHELCDYDGTPLQMAHRDVSPQNIFVTYDGITKVVDFGIAKAKLNATVTGAGELKGKLGYMAPERVSGRPSDRRADVFAMGIVLWELLAGGERLFKGDAAQAIQRVRTGPIPPLSAVAPGTPPGLEAIVARALERDPAARFASAEEMRAALEGFLRDAGAPAGPAEVGRALCDLFGEAREEARRRVRAVMAEVEAPPAETTPVDAVRLDGMKPAAALPLLKTPPVPIARPGAGVSLAPTELVGHRASRALGPRARLRRAGGALMLLAALGGGSSVAALRAQRARHAAALTPATSAAPPASSVGEVRLQTVPADAEVEYEGAPLGRTPTTLRLGPGEHALRLRKEGFDEESIVVWVEPERETSRAVVLRPNVAPSGSPPRPSANVAQGRRKAPASPGARPAARRGGG